MKGFFKRMAALAFAAAVSASLAVSACAFTFDFSDKTQTDEILADTKTIDGTSAVLEMDYGTNDNSTKMISIRCVLPSEYLESEAWNDPNVSVSIDVRLETEGADVIGYIPAFDTSWGWINPKDYVTLVYGEWVTITTSADYFYNNGFNKADPNRIMFQLRSQWGMPGQGVVKISVRDFRIEGGNTAAVTTTTEVTTTLEATTTTVAESAEPVDPVTAEESAGVPEEITAESEQTAETQQETEPAQAPDAPQTSAPTTTSQESAPATEKTAPPASSINYSEIVLEQPDSGTSVAMVIAVVGGGAVLIVGIAVAVFIIWKKKKFY